MGHKYLIAALSLVFLATGCGRKKTEEPVEPGLSVSAFNAGFGGGVYFDSPEKYSRLDLQSGGITNVLDSSRNMTSVSQYGDRLVTILRSDTHPQIQVLDRSKALVNRIPLPENPVGTPKLSRSGELILLGGVVGDTKVFNLKGEVVKNLRANISNYDWLPDGRIIFSRYGTLYVMGADFIDYKVFKELPGTVASLSVSPDGNRIAVSLSQNGVSHVWMIGPEGTLRQVSTSAVGENFPSWSPDGNNLVVAKGKLTTKGTPKCLELWVVNANLDTVNNLDKQEVSIDTVRIQQNVSGQISETCALSAPSWRAE